MCMMQEAYAVMDTDRDTIITAGETVTVDRAGQQIVVAEDGQNVFAEKSNAEVFREAHMDDDGFGPSLHIVQITSE